MANVLRFRGSDQAFAQARKNFGSFDPKAHGAMVDKVVGAVTPSQRRQLLEWARREFGCGAQAVNTGVYAALSFAAFEACTTPDQVAERVVSTRSAFGIFL